ncbi:MAG: PAS domain S-box protein [Halobacteriota archaeon]
MVNIENSGTVRRLPATAERTPDAFVRLDMEDRIQFPTPASEATLGYVPEELRGKPFTSLLSVDLAERHL